MFPKHTLFAATGESKLLAPDLLELSGETGTLQVNCPQALIFDLDLTLLVSPSYTFEFFKRVAGHFDVSLTKREYNKWCILAEDLWSKCFTYVLEHSEHPNYAALYAKIEAMMREFDSRAQLTLRPEYLREKLSPKVKLGIFTNRQTASAEGVLQDFGVQELFEIVGVDAVPRPKPHPDGILLLSERWGIAPRNIWYFDDTDYGVLAGAAANVGLCAGVRRPYQVNREFADRQLVDEGAKVIIPSLSLLEEVLRPWIG